LSGFRVRASDRLQQGGAAAPGQFVSNSFSDEAAPVPLDLIDFSEEIPR
jgi:hypothetical protein